MLKIIGTRRLKYQIKSILLIDWVYRYSILMGDRFCNIRNPEGKALSAHKSSINNFGFSEQCNATVNIDTLQNIPSAVPVSPFPPPASPRLKLHAAYSVPHRLTP